MFRSSSWSAVAPIFLPPVVVCRSRVLLLVGAPFSASAPGARAPAGADRAELDLTGGGAGRAEGAHDPEQVPLSRCQPPVGAIAHRLALVALRTGCRRRGPALPARVCRSRRCRWCAVAVGRAGATRRGCRSARVRRGTARSRRSPRPLGAFGRPGSCIRATRRRPSTATGRPLARYWAQFSACAPHTVTSK